MSENVVSGSEAAMKRGDQKKCLPFTPHEKIGLAADVVVFMQEKARGLGKNLSGKGFSEVLVLAEMLGSESVD